MKTKHVAQDNMHGNLPCLSFRNDSIYKVSVMFPYRYPSTHIRTPHMYCCVLEQSNSCLNLAYQLLQTQNHPRMQLLAIVNNFNFFTLLTSLVLFPDPFCIIQRRLGDRKKQTREGRKCLLNGNVV